MTATLQSIPILILSPHSRCNCRCVMCDIWKSTSAASVTAEELFRHLADIEALSVRWVVFSGGEPLMHPDLFRLADMLRQRAIRVTLLSSGLLLSRYAEQICGRIDDVIVSLDGPPQIHDHVRRVPGAFLELMRGIRSIHAINPAFSISGRCTIQKLNYAYPVQTARAAKELDLTSISFLAADVKSTAFNRGREWAADRQSQVALTLSEIQTLERAFEALDLEWQGTGFVAEDSGKLCRIANHFRAHLGLADQQSPRCNAPWVSAVVEADGTVRPCFFHRPIGSLQSHSLLQVLNGFEAQQFRSSLDVRTNPICRGCVCSLNWEGN